MTRTQSRELISTKQETIAKLARREPKLVLTTLAHHIDEPWLHEAYRRVRKSVAAGVDGVRPAEYEEDLDANLKSLLNRFKSGLYRAPAVRRVHLPKAGGKTRPIGIPTLEDKVLQRAVLMILEPVYEQDFLDCSYGFRPGRGAHQALEALWQGLMDIGGGWVIDLDIQSFFDSVDYAQLRSFLDQRVRDGVIRRAIGKWLQAGVMEEGVVWYPESGTPQGGVISPLLANIYLHEVLDLWFERKSSRCHVLTACRSPLPQFTGSDLIGEGDSARLAQGALSSDAQVLIGRHAMQPSSLAERVENRSHFAAAARAKLQIVLAPDHRTSQSVLGSVVVERQPCVVEKACQPLPASQQVLDRLHEVAAR